MWHSFHRKREAIALLSVVGGVCALLASGCSWPEQTQTPLQQGMEDEQNGDYNNAIADFNEAIRLNPKSEKAYHELGYLYLDRQEYVLAIACYTEAIELNQKNADAYMNRGEAYSGEGKYDQAIADYDQALDLYNSALQLDPKDSLADLSLENTYNDRAGAYDAKGDYDKAITDYSHVIQLQPTNAGYYYRNRGAAYDDKSDYHEAIMDYSHAIQLNPKEASYYNDRGLAHKHNGDFEDALADYEQAIRLLPHNPRAYDLIAWLLATCPQPNLRNGTKAVESATKACEFVKWKNPDFEDTLAAAYAEAGDFDDAEKWEHQYLASSNLTASESADARSRLALYLSHQPYHTEK